MSVLSSRKLYVRLLQHVRPYWRMFALSIVCMVVTAATEPLFPALMKPLLDSGFNAPHAHDVWLYPLGIVLIMALRAVFGFVADYTMAWVSNKVVLDLRNRMFERLMMLPTTFFDHQSSGVLLSKIAYDVTGVTGAATTVLTVLVRDSIAIIGLLAWLLYLNWRLTLVSLLMIPLIAIAVRLFSGRLRAMSRGGQKAMGEITHVLEEAISAHKVIKIFAGQEYEKQRFDAANRLQRAYSMRYTVAAAALGPLVQIFAAIALAIIVGLALHQSQADRATVGSFVSFITAMLMLLAPLKRLTDINAPLQRGLAAAESVFELMDETTEDDQGQARLGKARGEIIFQDVHFRYSGAANDALSQINFQIAPGEQIALVGPSGSGKTTISSLLARFYHRSGGRILIDGQDVESFSLTSLRDNIALVSQDVVLFNDTVAANIAYGRRTSVTRQEIHAAAQAAFAWEFIQAMPQGFDTLIGENGVKLSGGQRQRLAIARALLKDASILILDEATSALDSASEKYVQAALESLMKNRTTLIIAHRLSTIEKADRILVMQQGKIIETGTHQELLRQQGLYARLYQMQLYRETSRETSLDVSP